MSDKQIASNIVTAVRRRRLVVPVLLALSGLGWAAAHALAHRTVMSETATPSTAVNGYLSYLATSFALCLALALPLAAGAMFGKRWRGGSLRSLWIFGLVPVLGFAGHTVAEPLTGAPGEAWSASTLAPLVLVGLALQLPFALVAVGLARHLLLLAESLAHVLARHGPILVRRPTERCPHPCASRAPRTAIDLAHRQRGPPLLVA